MDEYNRDKAYRIFVTKSLQLIPQSKFITKDFNAFLKPQKIDMRSGDDIALDIMKRAGLRFGE